ncbi:MAG: hypothetical protein K6A92_07830 [Lachnospiraceae bacterium]|nr:hypothetical protein [Lachnospiraceae bacterium]
MLSIDKRLRIYSRIRTFFKRLRIFLIPVLVISPFRLIPMLEGFLLKFSGILRILTNSLSNPINVALLALLATVCVFLEGRRVRIYCFDPAGEKYYLGSELIRWGFPFRRRQFAYVTIPRRMAEENTTLRYLLKLPARFPKGVSGSRFFIQINHEITETKARKTVKFHIEKNHASPYTKT